MRILVIPEGENGNDYINTQIESLRKCGADTISIKEYRAKPEYRKNTDFAFLNWWEDLNSNSFMKNCIKYLLRSFFLGYLIANNTRIVYVMHNKTPHSHGFDAASISLRKKLLKKSSAIVILSNESKEVLQEQVGNKTFQKVSNKINLVPIATYEGVYRSSGINYRKKLCIPSNKFVFLFIGSIKPYKNIEQVIRLADQYDSKDVVVVISGEVRDKTYLKGLNDACLGKSNIIFHPYFINISEYYDLIQASNIVLLPYDLRSSLNSGSCIAAFSCGRNVVVPENGTVKDLPNNLVYSYSYKSGTGESEFFKAANDAYEEFRTTPSEFYRRQKTLHEYVSREFSIEKISQKMKNIVM